MRETFAIHEVGVIVTHQQRKTPEAVSRGEVGITAFVRSEKSFILLRDDLEAVL